MTSRRMASRTALGVLLAVTAVVTWGACRRGGVVRLGPNSPISGPVAAVLPYEFSDAEQPLPDGALLCYSDGDCVVHVVRECCPGCLPGFIAVNRAAQNAIARYQETHPCPRLEPCELPGCTGAELVAPPSAACQAHRCTLSW